MRHSEKTKLLEDPSGSGMVEADITINGVRLSFSESMTLRVALVSFHTYITDPACALGPIKDGYRHHLESISSLLHDPLYAAHEKRQERGKVPR